MDLKSLVEPVVALAEDAGRAILEVYSTDFEVQSKDDESPLTQADLASNRWIDAGLRSLTPDIPIISEESGLPAFEERSQWQRYWLIDPLDGTKEFVNRNDEFTVNIALIDNHRPVLGVVHVPVFEKTYVGCEGVGAQRRDGNDRSANHPGRARQRLAGARGRQPLPSWCEPGRLPRKHGRLRHGAHGQLIEILRCCRRRGRPLSATWTDLRMGHCCCPGGR